MVEFFRDWRRKTEAIIQYSIGFVLALSLWMASPFVTGEVEPWDTESLYYSVSTFAAGAISTLFWERKIYRGPLGIDIGQVTYCWLFLSRGVPVLPAPVAIAIFGTIQPCMGALMGWAIGSAFRYASKGFPMPSDPLG